MPALSTGISVTLPDGPPIPDGPAVLATHTLPAPSAERLTGKSKPPPTKLIEASGSEPSSSVTLPGLVELDIQTLFCWSSTTPAGLAKVLLVKPPLGEMKSPVLEPGGHAPGL